MAQFTVKWANGAEVTFEGDVTFEEVRDFLNSEPPALVVAPAPGVLRAKASPERDIDLGEDETPPMPSLDANYIEARLQEVGAKTDVERVTVMAAAAVEAGLPGLSIETAGELYKDLALRMPGVMRSTFSNAQTRGYLDNVGKGTFKPTSAGLNFARLGIRKPSPAKRRVKRGAAA
jgi:hypothetical protein